MNRPISSDEKPHRTVILGLRLGLCLGFGLELELCTGPKIFTYLAYPGPCPNSNPYLRGSVEIESVKMHTKEP